MAAQAVNNGGLVTGPDAADNYLSFGANIQPDEMGRITVLVQVTNITGTGIKFGVTKAGGAIPANAYSAPVGYKQVFTLNPNNQELHYQCSNAADAFNVSI